MPANSQKIISLWAEQAPKGPKRSSALFRDGPVLSHIYANSPILACLHDGMAFVAYYQGGEGWYFRIISKLMQRDMSHIVVYDPLYPDLDREIDRARILVRNKYRKDGSLRTGRAQHNINYVLENLRKLAEYTNKPDHPALLELEELVFIRRAQAEFAKAA